MTREPSIAMSWPNGAFDEDDRSTRPIVDVRDAGSHVVVEADVPGAGPKDVEVERREDTLIISIHLPKPRGQQPESVKSEVQSE
jgi:HSP20 family molecular chaperone IbpA